MILPENLPIEYLLVFASVAATLVLEVEKKVTEGLSKNRSIDVIED